jgi:hypothetical protein
MRGSLSNVVTNVQARMLQSNDSRRRMPCGRISTRNASRMSETDVVKQLMPFWRISTRNTSRMSATILDTETERETKWVY